MTIKLLDTSVCIAVIRGQGDVIERMASELPGGDLRIPAIVIFELAYGALRSRRPDAESAKVSRFIEGGPTPAAFDQDDAEAAGKVRAGLAARGQMIGAYDLLIAGQALARGWTVVTANTREFERVPGLTLEDWTQSTSQPPQPI